MCIEDEAMFGALSVGKYRDHRVKAKAAPSSQPLQGLRKDSSKYNSFPAEAFYKGQEKK